MLTLNLNTPCLLLLFSCDQLERCNHNQVWGSRELQPVCECVVWRRGNRCRPHNNILFLSALYGNVLNVLNVLNGCVGLWWVWPGRGYLWANRHVVHVQLLTASGGAGKAVKVKPTFRHSPLCADCPQLRVFPLEFHNFDIDALTNKFYSDKAY